MRRDSLSPDGTADAVPSVFGIDAVTRTFDTPEFRGITFHEVRARSIVNRVPGASRMPESPSGCVPALSQVATAHGSSQCRAWRGGRPRLSTAVAEDFPALHAG